MKENVDWAYEFFLSRRVEKISFSMKKMKEFQIESTKKIKCKKLFYKRLHTHS